MAMCSVQVVVVVLVRHGHVRVSPLPSLTDDSLALRGTAIIFPEPSGWRMDTLHSLQDKAAARGGAVSRWGD